MSLHKSNVLEYGQIKSTAIRDYLSDYCESIEYYSDSNTVDKEFGEKLLFSCGHNLKRFKVFNSDFEPIHFVTSTKFDQKFPAKCSNIEQFEPEWSIFGRDYIHSCSRSGIISKVQCLKFEPVHRDIMETMAQTCHYVQRLSIELKYPETYFESIQNAPFLKTIKFLRLDLTSSRAVPYISKILDIMPKVFYVEIGRYERLEIIYYLDRFDNIKILNFNFLYTYFSKYMARKDTLTKLLELNIDSRKSEPIESESFLEMFKVRGHALVTLVNVPIFNHRKFVQLFVDN